MQIVGYIIVLLLPSSFSLLITGLLLKGFGTILYTVGLFAMVADVVDYGDWKFGKHVEGMTYSAPSSV